eukprot:7388521-Prymnesium_polylepis.1
MDQGIIHHLDQSSHSCSFCSMGAVAALTVTNACTEWQRPLCGYNLAKAKVRRAWEKSGLLRVWDRDVQREAVAQASRILRMWIDRHGMRATDR